MSASYQQKLRLEADERMLRAIDTSIAFSQALLMACRNYPRNIADCVKLATRAHADLTFALNNLKGQNIHSYLSPKQRAELRRRMDLENLHIRNQERHARIAALPCRSQRGKDVL